MICFMAWIWCGGYGTAAMGMNIVCNLLVMPTEAGIQSRAPLSRENLRSPAYGGAMVRADWISTPLQNGL